VVTESFEGTSARLLPPSVGFAADIAALVGLVTAGGRPLVVAAGVISVVTGVYVVWKQWAKPVDRMLAVAVAIAALGAGVVGFSLKSSSTTTSPDRIDVAGSTTVSGDTTTTTASSSTPVSSPAAAHSTISTPATTATIAPIIHKPYKSGSNREYFSIDLEDGSRYEEDLTVGRMSLDANNGAQFVLLEPGAPDPAHDVCAARQDGDWRTSVPLADFREVARIFCIRTNDQRLGFVEVSGARMNDGVLASVYLRWTIWE
jgi:hypothetical protein